jgi:hypothetical protein
MTLKVGSLRDLVTELPWLGASTVALVVTLCVEHFLVHRQIVLPTLAFTSRPPFWMYAAMIVPELVVFFAAGYRLRSWVALVMYAGVGAAVRGTFHLALQLAHEPGHSSAVNDGLSEFAMTAPLIAVGYLLVLGVAAWSGEDERRLAGDP